MDAIADESRNELGNENEECIGGSRVFEQGIWKATESESDNGREIDEEKKEGGESEQNSRREER